MLNLQIHLRERLVHVLHVLDRHLYQLTPMPDDGSYGAYLRFGPKGGAQQSHRVQVLQPLAFMPVGPPSRNVFHVVRIGQARSDSMRFQNVVQRNPPGRRWRTELLRRWPPSAAQTWCAVFPRHAFTKALASAMQSKESVSPVGPAHTRRTACASAVASNRSCASMCTDATRCAARSNCRVC